MDWLSFIFWSSLLGTPVSGGVAWWLWLRRNHSDRHQWRTRLTNLGLLTVSANALLYYSWVSYRIVAGSTLQVWSVKDSLGNLSVYLVLLTLAGAIVGKGSSRIPIAICAILGFINWVPIAIL
jgi:hypothetical protein